jgi:hypothetical protein
LTSAPAVAILKKREVIMPQKITFSLYHVERRILMKKLINLASDKLRAEKMRGRKYKDIAADLEIHATRLAEVRKRKYMGEKTLLALLSHGIITKGDLDMLRSQNKFSEIETIIIDKLTDP